MISENKERIEVIIFVLGGTVQKIKFTDQGIEYLTQCVKDFKVVFNVLNTLRV